MSSRLDAVFGKLAKMPYQLSIHSPTALVFASGEMALQRSRQTSLFGKISKYYADDTDLSIFRKDGGTDSFFKGELVLRRTIPHYHIELWQGNTIWYSWSADANPNEDLLAGGKFASLPGMVGTWGYALLSLTLE